MSKIQDILDSHGVAYKLEGKNVARDHLNIPCPFCGDDPSEHLGINLETGYWSCWRNEEHSGRRLHRLLMRVLNKSYSEVDLLLSTTTIDDFDIALRGIVSQREEKVDKPQAYRLRMPREFREFDKTAACAKFRRYLQDRGFKSPVRFARRYDLRYCIAPGRWKDRVVVPVYLNGHLVTWTARAIHRLAEPRYKTLSWKADKVVLGEPVGQNIKTTIWNYDELAEDGGKILFIAEGPFDALKLDWLGEPDNYRATCLFGLSINDSQADLLRTLSTRFHRLAFLLDSGAELQGLSLTQKLYPLEPKVLTLPPYIKDPGDITDKNFSLLCGKARI